MWGTLTPTMCWFTPHVTATSQSHWPINHANEATNHLTATSPSRSLLTKRANPRITTLSFFNDRHTPKTTQRAFKWQDSSFVCVFRSRPSPNCTATAWTRANYIMTALTNYRTRRSVHPRQVIAHFQWAIKLTIQTFAFFLLVLMQAQPASPCKPLGSASLLHFHHLFCLIWPAWICIWSAAYQSKLVLKCSPPPPPKKMSWNPKEAINREATVGAFCLY